LAGRILEGKSHAQTHVGIRLRFPVADGPGECSADPGELSGYPVAPSQREVFVTGRSRRIRATS